MPLHNSPCGLALDAEMAIPLTSHRGVPPRSIWGKDLRHGGACAVPPNAMLILGDATVQCRQATSLRPNCMPIMLYVHIKEVQVRARDPTHCKTSPID